MSPGDKGGGSSAVQAGKDRLGSRESRSQSAGMWRREGKSKGTAQTWTKGRVVALRQAPSTDGLQPRGCTSLCGTSSHTGHLCAGRQGQENTAQPWRAVRRCPCSGCTGDSPPPKPLGCCVPCRPCTQRRAAAGWERREPTWWAETPTTPRFSYAQTQ